MSGRLLLVALFGLGTSVSTIAQTPVTARSAYDAKDWKTCAVLYSAIADRPVPISGSSYNAACCLALAGDKDSAFARLLKTPTDTLPGSSEFIKDTDLASLHDDPRWQPLLEKLKNDQTEREKHYDGELRSELKKRTDKDQDLRNRWIKNEQDKSLGEQVAQVDRDNTAWLKSVVAKQGWPLNSQVGRDAANQAWLLAQHADQDPAFQEQVLVLMQAAVSKDEASGNDFAYLTDRVRTARSQLQIYGTQFVEVDGVLKPKPIDDVQNVDTRRASVGLESMAEYVARGEQLMHRKIEWPPTASSTK